MWNCSYKKEPKNMSVSKSDSEKFVLKPHRRKSSLGSHHDVLNDKEHKYILGNNFLEQGYRMNYSPIECILSLFHMHNETLNVWTHLGGALIFLYFFMCVASPEIFPEGLGSKNSWIYPPPPRISALSAVPLLMFLGCAFFCFTASALFHLLQARNKNWYLYLISLDFSGIAIVNTGCYLPIFYCLFHCQPTVMWIYVGGISLCVFLLLGVSMSEKMSTDEYRNIRIALYLSVAPFGITPIIHAVFFSDSLEGIISSFCTKYMYTMACLIFGLTVYIFRFPECYFPGRFDFWMSSHQIWHMAGFMGIYIHYLNVHEVYEWREENMCH
jgi:adiponectin receptor